MIKNVPSVGVLDSGVGGLTVLKELYTLLPQVNYIYCADTQHAPYGEKSFEELTVCVKNTIEYLIERDVHYIVIACNTVSGKVLQYIQNLYPHITFIQMIQHGLLGLQQYNINNIGILATYSTVQEGSYYSAVKEYNPHSHIEAIPASRLVLWAEQGITQGKEVDDYIIRLLERFTVPLDILILACTHFPFFNDSIKKKLPTHTILYNPAHAVARQMYNVLLTGIGEQIIFSQYSQNENNVGPTIDWHITGNNTIVYQFAKTLTLLS